jgi:hypothetical protein
MLVHSNTDILIATNTHTHVYTYPISQQDIDELLNRGEERTEELKEKIEKVNCH